MRLCLRSLLGGLLLLAGVSTSSEAGPAPSPDTLVPISLTDTDDDSKRAALIRYESDAVSVSGVAELNPRSGHLRLRGTYTTRQGLDPDTRLAFHVYGTDGALYWFDGERTQWSKGEGEVLTAEFDYAKPLAGWGLPVDQQELIVQFNYVKEHEYWYDQLAPEAELPAFLLANLERGERFETVISWIPKALPQGLPVWSLHWLRTHRSIGSGPFNHLASMEARYVDGSRRDENRRYPIEGSTGSEGHFLATRMILEERGPVEVRLGFVWEGHQWFSWGPDERFATSHVVPAWLYAIMTLAAASVPALLLAAARKLRDQRLRVAVWILAVALGGLLCLEFLSPILAVAVALVLAAAATLSIGSPGPRVYWTLLSFVVAQELLWGFALVASRTSVQGYFTTLFLAAILFAPLALLRRSGTARAMGLLAVSAVAAYYLSIRLYFDFFQDYPNFNALSYASQGLDLTDSIRDLMQPAYGAAAVVLAWTLVLVCLPSRPLRREACETKVLVTV